MIKTVRTKTNLVQNFPGWWNMPFACPHNKFKLAAGEYFERKQMRWAGNIPVSALTPVARSASNFEIISPGERLTSRDNPGLSLLTSPDGKNPLIHPINFPKLNPSGRFLSRKEKMKCDNDIEESDFCEYPEPTPHHYRCNCEQCQAEIEDDFLYEQERDKKMEKT